MSQEADGSLWYSVLWGVWMYWIFRCWVAQRSSITRKDSDKFAEGDIFPAAIGASRTGMGADRCDQSSPTTSFFADALAEIARRDPSFALAGFLKDAAEAYEVITLAFSTGDRATLRRLVSPDVYDSFVAAIREQGSRQVLEKTRFVRIAAPEFESAVVIGDEAEITVRLAAELFRVRRDGHAVLNSSSHSLHTADLWTFGKSLSSPSPVWTLVATARPTSTLTIDAEAYAA